MTKIGIFYGSTTGNTETAAEQMQQLLGEEIVDIHDIDGSTVEQMQEYDTLILGIPTWDIGQLQEDWEIFTEQLDTPDVNFNNKKFAMFGVGDQEGYPDTFGDAIGMVYDTMISKNATPIVDQWPTESYDFEESRGVKNGFFVGMMLDEDIQPELSEERIKTFVELLKQALNL